MIPCGDPGPEPYSGLVLLNAIAAGQLEQVAAAVENVKIANLSGSSFVGSQAKRTPRSRKIFAVAPKDQRRIDRATFGPLISRLKGPDSQRFVGWRYEGPELRLVGFTFLAIDQSRLKDY
jgi:hypothetical protein